MQQIPQHNLKGQEVHIHDYLRVVYRRRLTFILTFLAIFSGVALYTFTTKPIYEASSTLHVRDEKGGKGDLLGDLGISRQNPIDAEIEIIKSRTNIEQVVKRLNLDKVVSGRSNGLSFSIVDFSAQVGKSYELKITGQGTYKINDKEGGLIGTGTSGVLLNTSQLRILIKDLQGNPGDSCQISSLKFQDMVASVKARVKAAEVGSRTNIIKLTYTDSDPTRARDIINTLSNIYLEQSIAFKTQEASKSLEFIEEQMASVREDLDKAEQALQVFKSGSGTVQLDIEATELIKKLSEIEKDKVSLSLQRKQVELALSSLKDAIKRGRIFTPGGLTKDDNGVSTIATKLAELEIQRRALLSELTETHPQVKVLQAQIDELQRKMLSTYETAQKNLVVQDASIKQTINSYEAQLKRLPQAERDLARLLRHTKVNSEIYTMLLQKHEEARIIKASTISNINVIDPAITPDKPIKPKKEKNILLGFLIGLMFGFGLAFFQEYLDDTIKDADEAKRLLGLPLLAVIPHIPKQANESEQELSLVCFFDPKSTVAESFRSLRTSIHFSAINRDKKIFLISSTFPGEGKTTVCANLGITLAQAGARILIIDCDLRRPSLHVKFGTVKLPGLTEVLAGDINIASVIKTTDIDGLSIVSAGTSPPNPAELLGSDKMRELLDSLVDQYDHILLDAPPTLAVTDAPVLSSFADLLILVLEAGRVPAWAAARMVETMKHVSAPIAGIILNDKSDRAQSYYGYYGGRYYSGRYYGYYGYYSYGYSEEASVKTAARKTWWNKMLKR